ncbi:MAG: hypothetical protein ACRD0O_09430, partial [Acidimicrobiia bacterium]
APPKARVSGSSTGSATREGDSGAVDGLAGGDASGGEDAGGGSAGAVGAGSSGDTVVTGDVEGGGGGGGDVDRLASVSSAGRVRQARTHPVPAMILDSMSLSQLETDQTA